MVDEALDHAGRFDVLQVLFAEDDGHLGDTGGHAQTFEPITATAYTNVKRVSAQE